MAVQLLPIELSFTTGGNVYAIIHGALGQVWNTTLNAGAGGWEAYNSAHWAAYAISLSEQSGSGYYSAAYPVGAAGVITSEVFYSNVTPTLGDAPVASISYSQGRNVVGIAGDPAATGNAQKAFGSEMAFAASGTPTSQVIPTSLSTAQALAAVGRALIMTSGVAANCAARVIGASGSTLTLAAPLPAAPVASDQGIIV